MNEIQLNLEQTLHFNQGQKLTPDQLNTLSEFARNRDALLTRLLSGNEGIVSGYESELTVQIVANDPMTLHISTGAAVNRQGETLILREPTLISLNQIASADHPVTYFLQIAPEQILESPFQDPEIPELKGYRFRSWVTRLKISRELDPRASEIARVSLDASVKTLRLVSPHAGVEPAAPGTVDSRFAPRFQVFSRTHLDFCEHQLALKAAQDFRVVLIRLKELFPRTQALATNLARAFALEAEVSDTFYQSGKIGFLLSEIKKSLLELVDELRDATKGSENYDTNLWAQLFASAELLGQSRGKAVRSEFTRLAEIAFTISEKILRTSSEKDRQVMIRENLADIRGYDFGMHLQHSFGGVLFRLVDSARDEKLFQRISATTDFATMKNLSARYLNDAAFSGRGAFYSEGRLQFKIENLKPGVESIVLMRLYKRRGTKDFALSLNGQSILQESLSPSEAVDKLIHVGALIDGNLITAGENTLSIDIQRVDLDFGLFGLFVYQEQGEADVSPNK